MGATGQVRLIAILSGLFDASQNVSNSPLRCNLPLSQYTLRVTKVISLGYLVIGRTTALFLCLQNDERSQRIGLLSNNRCVRCDRFMIECPHCIAITPIGCQLTRIKRLISINKLVFCNGQIHGGRRQDSQDSSTEGGGRISRIATIWKTSPGRAGEKPTPNDLGWQKSTSTRVIGLACITCLRFQT